MGAITDVPGFDEPVYSIDTTDQLLGGEGGPLNNAAQNLANRTAYLLAALNNFAEIQNWDVDHVLTQAEIQNSLVILNAAGIVLTSTLPTDVPYGTKAVVMAINVDTAQVSLICGGSDTFAIGADRARTTLYLGDGDAVELVYTIYGWTLISDNEIFEDVGGIIYRYKQIPNTLIAAGQLVNRVNYPRLWQYAQSLGASLITDATWLSTRYNCGFFSLGNGTSTFRLPDLRAMFIRGLDLGAGIDLDRFSSNPGGYEVDDFKAHDHGTQGSPGEGISIEGEAAVQQQFGTGLTTNTGGSETRPINIGLLPLIKV